MARQWFKRAWTRIVPATVERSTYVLFSSLALLLLFWKWEPMGGVVWSVENTAGRLALNALFAAGWLTVLVATFLINHFDLFGLRQVWLHLLGRPYASLKFRPPPVSHCLGSLKCGVAAGVLVGPGDDIGASGLRNRHHRVHFHSDSIRG